MGSVTGIVPRGRKTASAPRVAEAALAYVAAALSDEKRSDEQVRRDVLNAHTVLWRELER